MFIAFGADIWSVAYEHNSYTNCAGIEDSHPYFWLEGRGFFARRQTVHRPLRRNALIRVPRAAWRDRFKKAKAMGLNTITTYIFWNLHEPTPGKFDFTGNLDVAEFVREAGQEGLYVIVRPGPYICTEWEFGGIPSWLLKTPDLLVRTSDKRFVEASRKYVAEVEEAARPLQITHGGNIIMTQESRRRVRLVRQGPRIRRRRQKDDRGRRF